MDQWTYRNISSWTDDDKIQDGGKIIDIGNIVICGVSLYPAYIDIEGTGH